ncbi:MAG: class I SAM-dependent methyltransferase [Fluviicola sp.]|nr:class I SAM-dependent methyltransferase [Fluviicola sp.]
MSVEESKQPWPTKDAMEQVYTNHLWGGKEYDFYSGEGSYVPEIVNPYIDVLTSFLTSFERPLVVCDLGCGDFNVGQELVKYTQKYIAVDIVADLIEYNKTRFKAENLEFHCLDIAKDDLPVADCAIVRQVLQHLSNSEIQSIIGKLSDYKYVILTEHLPEEDFVPNADIISGQGTRLKKGSGVLLLEAPFNLKVKNEKELLSVNVDDGRIVTVFYEVKLDAIQPLVRILKQERGG